MDLDLTGKRALVTGGTKGIGLAVAGRLLAEGADLVICGRGKESLDEAVRVLGAQYGPDRITGIAADVGDLEDLERLVTGSVDTLGGIDIVVINPGHPPTSFESDFGFTDEDWRVGFDRLVLSAVRLSRFLVPGMVERGWGRVVLITTLLAKEPNKDHVLSGSLRACSHAYLKSLSKEFADRGVTCNAVMPGAIDTPRLAVTTARAMGDGRQSPDVALGIPLGRKGTADEVAAMVTFLCSGAASYMTGAVVPVDGGALRGI